MGVARAGSFEVVSTIERAGHGLQSLLRSSEIEIEAVGREFEDLARQTDAILDLAAGVIGFVEDEGVSSILPKVQSLGVAARRFIRDRLDATAGILETANAEVKLLDRLSELTRGQRSIARETQTLSVLTNIEVARLGQLGAGFQYLARELDDFSASVTKSTKELSAHTDERKTALEGTKRMLATGLPRIRQEFERIEADLESAMEVAGSSHAELSRAPMQFRCCAEEISSQIGGVVSAVQANDITRQQLEHVQDSLGLIAAGMHGMDVEGTTEAQQPPWIGAGLAIQVCQLKHIQETMGNWVEQIRVCMDGILQISSSDMGAIGPTVLKQEHQLSSQLARIEQLEQECQTDNDEVRSTFTGLFNLLQLVTDHMARSKKVRDRLQLLSFNSIIEANHLGAQADAILEISQSIKRISISWSEMTDRSGQVMEEILKLVELTKEGMEAFSQASDDRLREAQDATKVGLDHLRGGASSAAVKAEAITAATMHLQNKIAIVRATGDRLDANLGSIGAMLSEIEEARLAWDLENPDMRQRCDRREVEEMFSASYTTQTEREVLCAALDGVPLPVKPQNLAGNDVEFF